MGPMGPPGVAPSASEISPEGRPSHHLLGPKALLLCVPGPPPHAWAPDGSGPALVLAWGPWGVKGHPELWEAQDRGTPIPGPQRDDAESRSIAFAGRGRCGPALTPRLWARQETGETPPPGAPTPWPGTPSPHSKSGVCFQVQRCIREHHWAPRLGAGPAAGVSLPAVRGSPGGPSGPGGAGGPSAEHGTLRDGPVAGRPR